MPSVLVRWIQTITPGRKLANTNFEHSVLPSYGTVYLNHLIGEFESLKGPSAETCACSLGQEIVDRAKRGDTLTWGDTYVLERAVLVMLPDIEVHQRLWCLEARYRDAVGNSSPYDNYLRADASHLSAETIEHARARLDNLIRELYRLYTVIACREEMRSALSRTSLFLTLVLLILSLVAAIVSAKVLHNPGFVLFAIVFATGALGGALSFKRRLQDLPSRGESLGDLVELSSGSGIYFSPLAGGLFAIVLFVLFAAGLARGALFPALVAAPTSPAVSFLEFASKVCPVSVEDWGKLLIWSFIAGFAERFVPDTLDRLIARTGKKSKQSA